MTMDYTAFSRNLDQLIRNHGYTAASFAKIIKISQPTLSRYIAHKGGPDLECFIKIADYFNVSMDWLIGRNTGESLFTPEVQKLLALYNKASPDDKRVIKVLLQKYDVPSSDDSGERCGDENDDL